MSVSTTTNRVSFAGNGATTAFSYPYYFQSTSDLVVIVRNNTTGVETTKTLTTHYTISGTVTNNVYASGGTVTMVTAPASGETLIIYADPTATQTLDLVENDSLPAESAEQAYDKLTMLAQRLKNRLDRAVRLSDGFSPTFDPTLPVDLDDSADKVPLVNATGDGFAAVSSWPTADDIVNAQTNATAAAASATAAASSASAAATSATSAAASAASAAAQLNSAFFRDVVYITSADSPYTISSTHNGKLISCNTTGGNIAINLPSIAGLTLPFNVSLVKPISSNTVSISRNGTDTIAGATSQTLTQINAGCELAADTDGAPDDWAFLVFGEVPDLSIASGKLAADSVIQSKMGVTALDETVASKTSTFTITSSEKTKLFRVDCSGGAVTGNLPAAADVTGRKYKFIRTDNNPSTAFTIDPNGAETVRGQSTFLMHTQWQIIEIESNGTSWDVTYHYSNTDWSSGETTTITGSGGNPTKGTMSTDSRRWKREGAFCLERVELATSSTAGAADGTGAYRVALKFTADTTVSGTNANTTFPTGGVPGNIEGGGYFQNGSTYGAATAVLASSTTVQFQGIGSGAVGGFVWGSTPSAYAFLSAGTGLRVVLYYKYKVSGWEY